MVVVVRCNDAEVLVMDEYKGHTQSLEHWLGYVDHPERQPAGQDDQSDDPCPVDMEDR